MAGTAYGYLTGSQALLEVSFMKTKFSTTNFKIHFLLAYIILAALVNVIGNSVDCTLAYIAFRMINFQFI